MPHIIRCLHCGGLIVRGLGGLNTSTEMLCICDHPIEPCSICNAEQVKTHAILLFRSAPGDKPRLDERHTLIITRCAKCGMHRHMPRLEQRVRERLALLGPEPEGALDDEEREAA